MSCIQYPAYTRPPSIVLISTKDLGKSTAVSNMKLLHDLGSVTAHGVPASLQDEGGKTH